MPSKLVQLEDGTMVEAEVSKDEVREIAGGLAEKVEASFDKIQPILSGICRPVSETFKEMNRELEIDQAEIQLGLSFEGEGNLYVTKAKAGANLSIKIIMKPRRRHRGS